jgi:tetratricopeptide (TPR) repeat protein
MRYSSVAFAAFVTFFLILVPLPADATCGGGGGGGMGGAMPSMGTSPQVYFVPWKALNPGDQPLSGPLTVYWIPATREEVRKSELLSSRTLTTYASQCIGMQVINPDDAAFVEKLGVTGKTPTALLIDSSGKTVAHVDAEKGALRVSAVEKMVRDELRTRESELEKQLDQAKAKAATDKDGAVADYKSVWEQRCLFPRKARDAQKALKKLGVTVEDAMLRTVDPILTSEMNKKIGKLMRLGLDAEIDEHYDNAKSLYLAASQLDPADPVPLRFLAELDRHHLGAWVEARRIFNRILNMQADPLSRAVALHGIGKMTIHEGDSKKGLALFEQSIASYPLALTYRNLAVFWNSERDRAKADAYVKKAIELDPEEPFNLIFAATYMADSGRSDEALKIANEHEGMLCASYNLAAIHALLGHKGKAMELLKRHFYRFERNDSVRAKEMWEARVDYVFATLKDDPEFVKLTALAN